MEVILRENVDTLGRAGELVSVKDGYARNYLLPRGLAYAATEANKRRITSERKARGLKHETERSDADAVAARLAAIELRFVAKAGEGDKLFGSITSSDIAAGLADQGVTVDKRHIELSEPIKTIGVFKVPVRLHPEVKGEIQVWVVRE